MRRAEEGWARVYRRVWDHPVFKSHQEAAVFVWMMSVAAWRPERTRTEAGPVMLGVGELVITQREVAEQFGLTRHQLRGLLMRMRADGMVDCTDARPASGLLPQRAFAPTRITIRNYMAYQSIDSLAADTPARPAAQPQPTQEPPKNRPRADKKPPKGHFEKAEFLSANFDEEDSDAAQGPPYVDPAHALNTALSNIEEDSKTEERRPKKVRRGAPTQRQEGGVASTSMAAPGGVVADPGGQSTPVPPEEAVAPVAPVIQEAPTAAPPDQPAVTAQAEPAKPAQPPPDGTKPAARRPRNPDAQFRRRFAVMPDEMRADFLTFWSAYGYDVQKAEASREYVAARAAGVDAQTILDGARRYALATPQRWRRAAVNWLKGAQWQDGPVPRREREGRLDWVKEMTGGGGSPVFYDGPIPAFGGDGLDDVLTIDGEAETVCPNE